MPEMDGLEVLSELKHNKNTKHIPVFMLTDKGMIGNVNDAFETGIDDYIIKPLDLTNLGKSVRDKWERYTNQMIAQKTD